jgi:hypothetical protein
MRFQTKRQDRNADEKHRHQSDDLHERMRLRIIK